MLTVETIFSTPYSIFYLLPYSVNTILCNRQQKLQNLHLLKSILNYSITALESFTAWNLSDFDAQVGENMCEIRAHKNYYLSRKIYTSNSACCQVRKQLEDLKNTNILLEHLLADFENRVNRISSHNKDLDNDEELQFFLERNNLFFKLNEDVIYIIACYFLSHFCIRQDGLPIAINYSFIQRALNISKYKSKRLVQKYQIIMTQLGIHFVTNIASHIEQSSDYLQLIPLVTQISDDNRLALPCLLTSEILIAHCLEEQTPLLMTIFRKMASGQLIDIIYYPIIASNERKLIPMPQSINTPSFCIVMRGDVIYDENSIEDFDSYVKRISPHFLTFFLANMASHPQYTGERLAHLKDDPFISLNIPKNTDFMMSHQQKLLELKKCASIYGCCKRFPNTLYLRHIYAGTLNDEIEKLNREYSEPIHMIDF